MGLEDFLRQIPAQLLLMTCGSGVLLIIFWGVIIWRRASGQNRSKPAPAPVEAAAAEDESRGSSPGKVWKDIRQAVWNFFFYSEEEKEALKQGAPTPSAQPSSAAAEGPPDTVEVLRVWRDVVDGSLVIQVGGEYYRSLDAIRAAGQERRFLAVLRELAQLARQDTRQTSSSPTAPRPAAMAVPEESETAPPEAAPPPAAEDTIPAESSPPPGPAPVQPLAPPSVSAASAAVSEVEPLGSFFDNVKKAIKRGGKAPARGEEIEDQPPGIAGQIEAYLQYRIALTPEHQNRSIHVRPAADGSVRIEVDGVFHETVGDIPDEAVREFVITVIQEWEERQ